MSGRSEGQRSLYQEAIRALQEAQAEVLSQPGFADKSRRLMVKRHREFLANPSQALLQWATETYHWLHVAIEAELAGADPPVSCRIRCVQCCRLHILSPEIEALMAALWIREMPRQQRRRLAKRLRKWEQKLETFVTHKGHWDSQEEFLKDYADEFLWCPFLEHALCKIYPVRPLNCRCHFVTSPPEKCGGEEPVVEIDPVGPRLMGVQALAGMSTYLADLFGMKGLSEKGTFPKLVAQWLERLDRQSLSSVKAGKP